MDATRLIAATRHALTHAGTAQAIVAEAWQAQALVEAVGERLADTGKPPLRAGRARAAHLTDVRDPALALRELLEISGEARAALVAVARSTEEVALYWQCVEAADAVGDSADQVRLLLTRYETTPEPP